MQLLSLKPLLTEKTNALSVFNQYVFLVKGSPNKFVIKETLKKLVPDISIKAMNVLTVKPKSVRKNKRMGVTSKYKKVYLTVSNDLQALLGTV
jgi:ribosomal protein L23